MSEVEDFSEDQSSSEAVSDDYASAPSSEPNPFDIVPFVIYSLTTGIIRSAGRIQRVHLPTPPEGFGLVNLLVTPFDASIIDLASLQAIPFPQPTLSKATVAADGVDYALLQGVLQGASIAINDAEYLSDGTDVELVAEEPCTYAITVAYPELNKVFRFEVTAE
ncbi:hypothetical protein SAMN05216548_114144 [Faunimonas pinastri]|uniref:Uncharacterized protein n=1 Tax=Faunimonas pinastri TaxID=1855383 RepID=A0A1H9N206_9HYPH|nr:hypothetical protein [Faunimonas pinastri]SER29817.1 hypothetical protein SAMN05216548_114144 [Faunimonas pinastri]